MSPAHSTVLQDTLAELGILGLVPYLERRLSPCQQYHEQPQQQPATSQSPGVAHMSLADALIIEMLWAWCLQLSGHGAKQPHTAAHTLLLLQLHAAYLHVTMVGFCRSRRASIHVCQQRRLTAAAPHVSCRWRLPELRQLAQPGSDDEHAAVQ